MVQERIFRDLLLLLKNYHLPTNLLSIFCYYYYINLFVITFLLSLFTIIFSLLFTIVRNTCTLLCHKLNQYKFGRRDAFESCLATFSDFPINVSDYDFLASKKIQYERGIIVKTELSPKSFDTLLTKVNTLIAYAKEKLSTS